MTVLIPVLIGACIVGLCIALSMLGSQVDRQLTLIFSLQNQIEAIRELLERTESELNDLRDDIDANTHLVDQ